MAISDKAPVWHTLPASSAAPQAKQEAAPSAREEVPVFTKWKCKKLSSLWIRKTRPEVEHSHALWFSYWFKGLLHGAKATQYGWTCSSAEHHSLVTPTSAEIGRLPQKVIPCSKASHIAALDLHVKPFLPTCSITAAPSHSRHSHSMLTHFFSTISKTETKPESLPIRKKLSNLKNVTMLVKDFTNDN